MRVHWCLLDKQCRQLKCPPRVHLDLGLRHWYINVTDWSDRGYWKRGHYYKD